MTLLRCQKCGEYSLNETCSKCAGTAIKAYPPRFSPEDKYGKYRRRLKILAAKNEH